MDGKSNGRVSVSDDENAGERMGVNLMSASLIGHWCKAPFVLPSVPLVPSPLGACFFTQSVSAFAALEALAGEVWRAVLLGVRFDGGVGDMPFCLARRTTVDADHAKLFTWYISLILLQRVNTKRV